MIKPSDLEPVDEDTAVQLLVLARSIAPCLDTLADGAGDDDPKPRRDAIAILKAVARRRPRPAHIKSERNGPTAAEYFPDASWFSGDDRDALQSLCSVNSSTVGTHPVGSFPTATPLANVWPEGEYS